MLVECIRRFRDLSEPELWREEGERFEVDDDRFKAINSTRYGALVKAVEGTKKGKPNKEELLARAGELGIEVPEKATNPQIAELIKEAESKDA